MSKLKISEDWTSTIVGWFIILLVIKTSLAFFQLAGC